MSFLRRLTALWNRAARPTERFRVWNVTRRVELARYVDVAGDAPSRRKGLLGRDRLGMGEGLWIVPCEAVHTFGMRFPIDLVYLDRNKRIKKIRHAVPRGRVSACLSAHSVLELAAGSVQRARTEPGDALEFIEAHGNE